MTRAPGSQYSDEDRRNAIGHYLVLGSLRRVEDATGIPNQTLSGWTKTDWWNQAIGKIRAERNDELDNRLSAAVDKALDGIMDRLEHGDAQVIDGEIRRVPIKARDLAVVTGVTFDKRQLLRSMPTSINQSAGGMDALAGRMVKLLERAAEVDVTPNALNNNE